MAADDKGDPDEEVTQPGLPTLSVSSGSKVENLEKEVTLPTERSPTVEAAPERSVTANAARERSPTTEPAPERSVSASPEPVLSANPTPVPVSSASSAATPVLSSRTSTPRPTSKRLSVDKPIAPPVPTIAVPVKRIRWLKLFAALNGIVVASLLAGLAYTVPRSFAYSSVLDENLALKERLDDIDDKMSEVDRMLLRLRLYDFQLKSLGTPTGDHGPVDNAAEEFAMIDFANVDSNGQVVGAQLDHLHEGTTRAADAWARAVELRADAFIESMRRTEPNLTDLVVELEDLRALEAALPTRWPAKGAVTSGYGYRRNPVGFRDYRFHSGLDIANAQGTPIYAAADALVKRSEYSSGYGNILELDHGYGITTVYAHNRRLFVKKGERVLGGQKIALMGSTGKSTGPHLHFEVRLDGNAVDPLDYLPHTKKKRNRE